MHYRRAHNCRVEEVMKNITFSADEQLIELARKKAIARHHTLNDEFRDWLRSYVANHAPDDEYQDVMQRLAHVNAGRRFSRDDANER
jgi:hypothetical protein